MYFNAIALTVNNVIKVLEEVKWKRLYEESFESVTPKQREIKSEFFY